MYSLHSWGTFYTDRLENFHSCKDGLYSKQSSLCSRKNIFFRLVYMIRVNREKGLLFLFLPKRKKNYNNQNALCCQHKSASWDIIDLCWEWALSGGSLKGGLPLFMYMFIYCSDCNYINLLEHGQSIHLSSNRHHWLA